MGEELERVKLLLGEEAVVKLKNSTVLVAGVGGVGSYAAEALARLNGGAGAEPPSLLTRTL